jgi:hypothetical protein
VKPPPHYRFMALILKSKRRPSPPYGNVIIAITPGRRRLPGERPNLNAKRYILLWKGDERVAADEYETLALGM